jgi:hypothetical protein
MNAGAKAGSAQEIEYIKHRGWFPVVVKSESQAGATAAATSVLTGGAAAADGKAAVEGEPSVAPTASGCRDVLTRRSTVPKGMCSACRSSREMTPEELRMYPGWTRICNTRNCGVCDCGGCSLFKGAN